MSIAVLEKPSLMDLSLEELRAKFYELPGSKKFRVQDLGNRRHKKTWIAAIETVSRFFAKPEPTEPVEIPCDEEILIGTETDIPFTDDEDGEDEEIELVYSNIPEDGFHSCPPPPPPTPIIRTCPLPQQPSPEKQENPPNTPGADRRVVGWQKECYTCEGSGLLSKNITCCNCGGKGYRNRQDQLTVNIRNICRKYVGDMHDYIWGWQGGTPLADWQDMMKQIADVRWRSTIGKDIWQLCQGIRDLYDYCQRKMPNWGQLLEVPELIKRIDENHWLLLLIFFDAGQDFEDGDYSAIEKYYFSPEIYDKNKVLGKTHLFILPNEMQEDSVIDGHYVEDCMVLRGAE